MSIINVANRILDNLGTMTTMRLQKLTYYAQAHSLATTDRELFYEDFEAWDNGPVSLELFNRYRDKVIIHRGCLIMSLYEREHPLNKSQLKLIDTVSKKLKNCSGLTLYNRVITEMPWRITRMPHEENKYREDIILKSYMKTYYKAYPAI